MTDVGLRELRQSASDLIRRVEPGEEFTITVAGRPSARLVAGAPRRWRAWDEVDDLFHGPGDSDRVEDRERLDDTLTDPCERP